MNNMAENKLSFVMPPTPLLFDEKISLHPCSKMTRKSICLFVGGGEEVELVQIATIYGSIKHIKNSVLKV